MIQNILKNLHINIPVDIILVIVVEVCIVITVLKVITVIEVVQVVIAIVNIVDINQAKKMSIIKKKNTHLRNIKI